MGCLDAIKSMVQRSRERYESIPVPAKASLWFTVCNVVNKGLALLSTPVLTRILSQEQYGMFSVYQSWIAILTIFATMNLYQSAFMKGLVQYEDDRDALESSLLALSSLITVGTALFICLTYGFWGNVFKMSPFLAGTMFVEIFFVTAYEFWAARQRFGYKYRMLAFLSILMTVVSLGTGIGAVLLSEYKVEARVLADVVSKSSVGFILFILIMCRGRKLYDKRYWKYSLLFNLPLLPHFLSHFILNQSDRIMISTMIGSGQAAVYSVAYSISMMMLLVTGAVNNSYTPYTYQKIKENDIRSVKRNSTPLFLFVAVLCALTMAFGPEIVWIFAGEKYMDAVWIIPPVAASVYFIFIYSMFVNIEYYHKRTMGISGASFGCAALNLVLNCIFIKMFGYFAAGYTTLASYIALALIHFFFYHKIVRDSYGGEDVYDIKIIPAGMIVVFGGMVFMLIFRNYLPVRLGFVAAVSVLGWMRKDSVLGLLNKEK